MYIGPSVMGIVIAQGVYLPICMSFWSAVLCMQIYSSKGIGMQYKGIVDL